MPAHSRLEKRRRGACHRDARLSRGPVGSPMRGHPRLEFGQSKNADGRDDIPHKDALRALARPRRIRFAIRGPVRSPENRAAFCKRDMNPPKNKLWDSRPESRSCLGGDSRRLSDARDADDCADGRLYDQYGLPIQPPVSHRSLHGSPGHFIGRRCFAPVARRRRLLARRIEDRPVERGKFLLQPVDERAHLRTLARPLGMHQKVGAA